MPKAIRICMNICIKEREKNKCMLTRAMFQLLLLFKKKNKKLTTFLCMNLENTLEVFKWRVRIELMSDLWG